MPNPLEALRKASSIGPDPYGVSDIPISRGEMPLGAPMKLIAGLRGLFSGLGKKMAPEALQGLQRGMSARPTAMETLGELNPEFTPVGGEGIYNVAKRGLQQIADPAMEAYHNLLRRGGR